MLLSLVQSRFKTEAGTLTSFKDSKAADMRLAAYDKVYPTFSTDMWQQKVTERCDAKTGATTANHVLALSWLSAEESEH